jgi:hypothetical protein
MTFPPVLKNSIPLLCHILEKYQEFSLKICARFVFFGAPGYNNLTAYSEVKLRMPERLLNHGAAPLCRGAERRSKLAFTFVMVS